MLLKISTGEWLNKAFDNHKVVNNHIICCCYCNFGIQYILLLIKMICFETYFSRWSLSLIGQGRLFSAADFLLEQTPFTFIIWITLWEIVKLLPKSVTQNIFQPESFSLNMILSLFSQNLSECFGNISIKKSIKDFTWDSRQL